MQLKAPVSDRIVTAMKRLLLLLALVLFPSILAAQPYQFGILIGAAEPMEDGFDLKFGEGVREVFFGARLETNTMFNVKLGQTDSPVTPSGLESLGNHSVDYVLGQVEYQFDEVWGSSSVFAGPGLYRSESGGEDATELGFSGGVSASFPVNRRFAFMVELAYHWVDFEQRYTFISATGGFRVAF